MSKMVRGRQYRSEVEKRRIVESYEGSGLTQERFCRERGVSLSNLHRWLGKARAVRAHRELESAKPQFVEVVREAGNHWEIELEFGGGVVLRMRR